VIQRDRNLEILQLLIDHGITDEADVNLAEALTVNENPPKFTLAGIFDCTNAWYSYRQTYRRSGCSGQPLFFSAMVSFMVSFNCQNYQKVRTEKLDL
jgi:hypothetical protein